MALNPSNSSNFQQLALKGLNCYFGLCVVPWLQLDLICYYLPNNWLGRPEFCASQMIGHDCFSEVTRIMLHTSEI